MHTAGAAEGKALQFAENRKKVIAAEYQDHADRLPESRDLMKQNEPADECPERRARADRGGQGNRQVAHRVINACPAGAYQKRFEKKQKPYVRSTADRG